MPEVVAIDPQTLIHLTEHTMCLVKDLQNVLASLKQVYPDQYVSTEEAAEIMGVTTQNVRYMARRGTLKSIKDGPRLVRISVQSIRAYMGNSH